MELAYERILARDTRDMRDYGMDELQHWWFFHLSVAGRPRETWRGGELGDGSVRIPFDFFWASLRTRPEFADHGDKIGLLLDAMSL